MPKKKAIATERNIPNITDSALPVLSKSANSSPVVSPAIFIRETTKVAPKSSKTIDTVVDVGIPRELNMSINIMSVTITAINIHINS